jgi:hypothetical protein
VVKVKIISRIFEHHIPEIGTEVGNPGKVASSLPA